jgi:hypothetical protein
MKKSLIITVGILLILFAVGVWMYLLFFGAPEETSDIFANLGLGNEAVQTEPSPPGNVEIDPAPITQIGTTQDALRQLTTKAVAGFGFVGSSSTVIRYAERGTGHIFEIDTVSATERRISGTTIPRVVEAVFAHNGMGVALVSERGYTRDIVAGFIDEKNESVDLINLPDNSSDPSFVSDTMLRYIIVSENRTDGFGLDIENNTPSYLFSTPLRDIEVIWGENTYVYNRPSATLQGALYRAGEKLTPVTISSFGFVGGVTDDYYIGSAMTNNEFNSYALNKNTSQRTPLAITYLPEKCTPEKTNTAFLWCASPLRTASTDFIDAWYTGSIQSQDLLWRVSIEDGTAQLVSDFLSESGRLIDVDRMGINHSGTNPIFRNKVDNTLWLYDTKI